MKVDFVVVGGGIVGLATAYQLVKNNPGKKVVVLEKEDKVASHQSGRNSGVIHSGIYYKPGSFKAVNCRRGKKLLEQFCKNNDIPYQQVGKLIVATTTEELRKLWEIYERGKANEIDCRMVMGDEIPAIEPNATGLAAIHVEETGIVNYKKVCQCFVEEIENVYCGEKVLNITENNGVVVTTNKGFYVCDVLINCGGLYSDHVAKSAGKEVQSKIIPFRGEYYTLSPSAPYVRGLIYPVPDPSLPFLGVHLTKMVDGGVECGPNAVFAFGRESYNRLDINLSETWETLMFPGFWKLAYKYWKTGIGEMMRSCSKFLYAKSLQRLVPSIKMSDLVDNRPAGIRAQAVSPEGNLVDEFVIEKVGNVIHVLNAPSPAATACLAIGEKIIDHLK